MNPSKRVHASVIVLLALTAWFLPVPDGLKDTKANKARFIARKLNLHPDKVRMTVRFLTVRIDKDKIDEGIDEDIVDKIVDKIVEDLKTAKQPLNKDQVHKIRKELTADKIISADPELELLRVDAWKLFIIFIATIAMILVDVMPIFVCSLGALAIAILTDVLTYKQGFSGFHNDTIILIVVAFAIAHERDGAQ